MCDEVSKSSLCCNKTVEILNVIIIDNRINLGLFQAEIFPLKSCEAATRVTKISQIDMIPIGVGINIAKHDRKNIKKVEFLMVIQILGF